MTHIPTIGMDRINPAASHTAEERTRIMNMDSSIPIKTQLTDDLDEILQIVDW